MKEENLPMNEVGIIPSRSKGREYIVQNAGAGAQLEKVSLDKGDDIILGDSGATIYDESIADEVKEKYKNDPRITVIEKDHIKLRSDGSGRWMWHVNFCSHPGCFARLANRDFCMEHLDGIK